MFVIHSLTVIKGGGCMFVIVLFMCAFLLFVSIRMVKYYGKSNSLENKILFQSVPFLLFLIMIYPIGNTKDYGIAFVMVLVGYFIVSISTLIMGISGLESAKQEKNRILLTISILSIIGSLTVYPLFVLLPISFVVLVIKGIRNIKNISNELSK